MSGKPLRSCCFATTLITRKKGFYHWISLQTSRLSQLALIMCTFAISRTFIAGSALKYLFLNVPLPSQGSTLRASFLYKLGGDVIRNTDMKRWKINRFKKKKTWFTISKSDIQVLKHTFLVGLRLGVCGFDTWLGHTKDYRNRLHWLPAWQSVFLFGHWGVRSPNDPRALPTAPSGDVYDKFHILWDQWGFNLNQ